MCTSAPFEVALDGANPFESKSLKALVISPAPWPTGAERSVQSEINQKLAIQPEIGDQAQERLAMTSLPQLQAPLAPTPESGEERLLRFRHTEDGDAGPANQVLALLALSLASEEEAGTAGSGAKWPLAKTVALLCAGCGLFWLLAFAAIGGMF